MGLIKRFKTIRRAEKRKKEQPEERIDIDELDDLNTDAGDHLEAEILAELEDGDDDNRRR